MSGLFGISRGRGVGLPNLLGVTREGPEQVRGSNTLATQTPRDPMSGTDSPVPMMIPGFSLHDELEVIVDIGLSPYDALRTSTYNPARYLEELDEFGIVEVDKRADLVLLEGNPLEDITHTRRIEGVMVRGRWYTRTDLDVMLEKVAKAHQE